MSEVRLELDGPVAVITIDSPDNRNALSPEMGEQVIEVCERIDADPLVGAAVVRGANQTFRSGVNLRLLGTNWDPASDATFQIQSKIYAAFVRIGELTCPTIAAVRGAAVGAGLNLALACDLRIMSDTARLLSGFMRAGMHPGGGYFAVSGRTAGREATAAMGLFGQEVSGLRAAAIGLAWEALPDGEVEARALELAHVAARDPALARAAVRSFRLELGPPALSWPAALSVDRGTQMWSQRRHMDAQAAAEQIGD